VATAQASSLWDAYVPVANVVGGFATGFAAGIAIATIIIGVWQVRRTILVARETNALETYNDYLKLCVERPELSSHTLAVRTLPGETVKGILRQLTVETERYLWFVSVMLNACEKIVLSARLTEQKDPAWTAVVLSQLSYHRSTLREVWPEWRRHYSDELRGFVERMLAEEEAKEASRATGGPPPGPSSP